MIASAEALVAEYNGAGRGLGGVPDGYWIGFLIVILVVIAADLAVFRKRGHSQEQGSTVQKSLLFLFFVLIVAVGFGIWMARAQGQEAGLEFASGYLIEISLSIDNLFVFLVLFRAFGLSRIEQRKALFYGVLGAIVLRCLLILGGIALLERFAWIEFVFGAFLLVTSLRLLRKESGTSPPGWVGMLMKWTGGGEGGRFYGAIAAIELVDIVFALDSIPAVLAVTNKTFVAYTSNIMAILGLRSLYFLLDHVLSRLRYLHYGLAAILAFVGLKMILQRWARVPTGASLGVIVGLAAIATVASLWRREPDPPKRPTEG